MSEQQQQFWALLQIVGAPIFIVAWGGIGLIALLNGGTQFGGFLTVVALLVAVAVSFQPYVATVRPDGTLVFQAVLRRSDTRVDDVYRITVVRGRGRSYVFWFDDRKASLGQFGGRDLARYLVARNPALDHDRL